MRLHLCSHFCCLHAALVEPFPQHRHAFDRVEDIVLDLLPQSHVVAMHQRLLGIGVRIRDDGNQHVEHNEHRHTDEQDEEHRLRHKSKRTVRTAKRVCDVAPLARTPISHCPFCSSRKSKSPSRLRNNVSPLCVRFRYPITRPPCVSMNAALNPSATNHHVKHVHVQEDAVAPRPTTHRTRSGTRLRSRSHPVQNAAACRIQVQSVVHS